MRLVYLLATLLVLASIAVAQSPRLAPASKENSRSKWSSLSPDAQRAIEAVLVADDPSWSQQAELTASDGLAQDGFGCSIAISGNTIVVGAQLHAVGSNQIPGQGAAYVFVQSGGMWSQQAELIASDGASWDFFGTPSRLAAAPLSWELFTTRLWVSTSPDGGRPSYLPKAVQPGFSRQS
jgi:hypothetical protein